MRRMTMKQFVAVVEEAIDTLPDAIKRHLDNVVIDVEEAPTDDFLREAGFTDEEIDAGDTLYGYFMPMEGVGMVYDEGLVTSEETQARLEHYFGPLEHVASPPGDPARVWRIPGAQGTIGFISPVSEPFCSTCNRVRLSADGKLRLCLLRPDEVDLRELMRNGGDDAAITRLIRSAVWRKPWGHGIAEGDFNVGRGMSQIGG